MTAADECEPALEVALLELCDEELEVDGAGVGVDGGVQVGQLVPPLRQVAKALELARARRAAASMVADFTVGPRWWWGNGTAPGGA